MTIANGFKRWEHTHTQAPGQTLNELHLNGTECVRAEHISGCTNHSHTLQLTSLALLLLIAETSAAELVWTNTAGGSWNTAANWSPNQIPTAADRVWITNNGTYTVTVSGNAAAGELILGGTAGIQTLSLTSGALLLGNGTGNSNAVLRISGGTLGGSGRFTSAGPLNWTGGTITNTVQCAGGSISGSATKTLRYGCLINAGLLTFSGGYLEPYNGASVSNLAGAIFDITADCDISYYSTSSGPIYNSGIFRKSGGTSTTLVGTEFHNEPGGTTEIQSGTLRFSGGGDYDGTVILSVGTTLEFNAGTHRFAPGLNLTGPGALKCGSAAILNLESHISINALVVDGGKLTGPGSVTANRLTWNTGTITCTVQCGGGEILTGSTSSARLDGGRLINTGLLVGGLIATEDGATITNLPGGIIDFTNTVAGIRHDAGAYGAFYNAGLLRRTTSTMQCSIGEPFINTGTVESRAGSLRFARSFVQTGGSTLVQEGSLVADQGLCLLGGELSGTNVVRGNVTNNATVRVGIPGRPIGLLTIEGSYVETTNAHLQIDIGGTQPGIQHDQLVVTNLVRLAGTLEIALTNGFIPGPGIVITGLVSHTRLGTFSYTVKPAEFYVLYMPKTVLLETENAPPVVQMSVNPIQLACHAFEVQASATDPDGTVTNLTFLLDGVGVCEFPKQAAGKTSLCLDFPGEVVVTARATDNEGAMGETNVAVTITTLPLGVLDPAGFHTNRAFKLCMCGEPGSNYVIETTTDLPATNWTVIGTMENTNGIWRFFDTATTNATRKFYRARRL